MVEQKLSVGIQKILSYLYAKRLTQKEFCRLLGINKNTFQNWKNGSKPSLQLINKLRQLIPDIQPEDFESIPVCNTYRDINDMLDKIIWGDALQTLCEIPSNSIHLVITSPPYNAGHNYEGYDDTKDWNEYLNYMSKVIKEIYRVLVNGGRLCLNVPFAVKNRNTKEVRFLAVEYQLLCHEAGFNDFEMILWHKGRNEKHFQGNNTAWGSWKSPSCPNMRPVGEPIMIFSKGTNKLEGNKELADISAEEFKEWTKNVWYVPEMDVWFIPNSADKSIHPCPFPEELVERLIKLYSYVDNIILDPFNGQGTTTAVAKKLGRHFIGIDISHTYCEIAKKRLADYNITFFDLEERRNSKTHPMSSLIQTNMEYDIGELVNPQRIVEEPVNRWFFLKESFSGQLVEFILKRYDLHKKVHTLLDPFMGGGSALYKALDLNIKGVGFDINPIAFLAANVKTAIYNDKDVELLYKLLDRIDQVRIEEHSYPPWAPISRYVPKHVLNSLLSLRNFVETIENRKIKELLELLWLSMIEDVSNYKKDGNGIKFKENYITSCEEVLYRFKLKVKEAIHDIELFFLPRSKQLEVVKPMIFQADSRQIERYLSEKIDVVVTSPPYANCFDYFETYKIELWLGGFITSLEEWRTLKKQAVRSNLNAYLSKSDRVNDPLLKEVVAEIEEKIEKGMIRNKNIPTMLNNYFFDIEQLLKKLKNILVKKGMAAFVVGNSAYGGVVVPTDQIIANIGRKQGFESELIEARKLRTSSQQMSIIKTEDKEMLRESIVILQKIA